MNSLILINICIFTLHMYSTFKMNQNQYHVPNLLPQAGLINMIYIGIRDQFIFSGN